MSDYRTKGEPRPLKGYDVMTRAGHLMGLFRTRRKDVIAAWNQSPEGVREGSRGYDWARDRRAWGCRIVAVELRVIEPELEEAS